MDIISILTHFPDIISNDKKSINRFLLILMKMLSVLGEKFLYTSAKFCDILKKLGGRQADLTTSFYYNFIPAAGVILLLYGDSGPSGYIDGCRFVLSFFRNLKGVYRFWQKN